MNIASKSKQQKQLNINITEQKSEKNTKHAKTNA